MALNYRITLDLDEKSTLQASLMLAISKFEDSEIEASKTHLPLYEALLKRLEQLLPLR